MDDDEGIEFMRVLRAGVERPGDVYIFLLAEDGVNQQLLDDIEQLVWYHMGEETISIVRVVQGAPVEPVPIVSEGGSGKGEPSEP